MKSSVYRDIIDDKVAEWRNNLSQLEALVARSDGEKQKQLEATVNDLRKRLDSAVVQLLTLDSSETVENTVETKNQILEIFSSVDSSFPQQDTKTPYML